MCLQFTASSAVVSDLKMLDEVSVIGSPVNCIKQLVEREKLLEEEVKKRKPTEESVVSPTKKPRPSENVSDGGSSDQQSPSAAEVQVKITGEEVLIRVQCKNHKKILLEFISLIEKIGLSIKSCSFVPLEDEMHLINAVAQIDEGFCMTVEVLASYIQQALLKIV